MLVRLSAPTRVIVHFLFIYGVFSFTSGYTEPTLFMNIIMVVSLCAVMDY